jgi:hypothetical protein
MSGYAGTLLLTTAYICDLLRFQIASGNGLSLLVLIFLVSPAPFGFAERDFLANPRLKRNASNK